MTHGGGFWATLELLVSESTLPACPEDIEDWLEIVSNKIKFNFKNSSVEETSKETDKEKEVEDYRTLIECNISHPTVRSRLETLMGSNVVRLTDRKYMLKLMSKIREDHETKQQNRIEERKKRELKRMKTMILNRLIPVQEAPEDIKQYPIFQLYLYCDAIKNAKRKRRSRKMVRIRESLYQLLYPREKGTESAEDDAEEELCMKRIKVNEETQLVPLTPEEVTTYLKEQEELKDIEDGYILNQEEFDRLHYETDAVKHLREAQTVEEMYAEAHAIVRILYSYADEGRYTKTEGKDENEETSEDGEENEGENETED
ncbi:uncharacterized protein LOC117172121 isoform X2 [Belonocnema kinseyi]|uniref:uncharacterized protein LOC117172121 isoform X2 n=1 Tax=Belonocnema kinseyi TaxID=2817044 RepID=UPI00143CC50F|nr:uncharacterized protein LOC117172121 isoform X2 [Belonocnema kinseyi]